MCSIRNSKNLKQEKRGLTAYQLAKTLHKTFNDYRESIGLPRIKWRSLSKEARKDYTGTAKLFLKKYRVIPRK